MNAETILPVLLELFVKSACIALAATLLLRAWRGVTAAQRHLVWFVALATVLLLPCTRLVAPLWKIPFAPAKKTPVVVTVRLPAHTAPLEVDPSAHEPAVAEPVHQPFSWRQTLLGVWGAGAALLLGYRVFGSWRLHLLLRRSAVVDDPRIRLLLSRTLSELGLRRHPEIRFSEECQVPITWGSLRPVMLLPKMALEWSDNWILAALRHEAAHISRHDYLTRWFAHVACALYWPNPLVWLLARALRLTQELAADDLVLCAGTPADEYATQLVHAARTVVAHGFFVRQAVAMACPSTLEDRVRAIVDSRRDRRPLSRWAAACGSATIALALGLSTAAQLRSDGEKPADSKAATEKQVNEFDAFIDYGHPITAVPAPQIEIETKFIELRRYSKKGEPPRPNDWWRGGLEPAEAPAEKVAVFTDPQFQIIIRSLNQKKGVDLLSSPRITTRPGQPARIEITRVFNYPIAWEKDGKRWTPTKFEAKNVGTVIEVEPRLLADGSIELHEKATLVEFMGFAPLEGENATPIMKKGTQPPGALLPPVPKGERSRPVFSECISEETVKLKSGETVAIGDLPVRYDEQQVVDGKSVTLNLLETKALIFLSTRLIQPAPEMAALKIGGAPADTTIAVTVDKEGKIKLNGVQITLEDVGAGCKALLAAHPGAHVVLRGGDDTRYSAVMAVMERLQKVHIDDVAFASPKADDGTTIAGANTLTFGNNATNSVTFTAPATPTAKPNDLITKEWKLPPGFIPAKADGSGPVSAKDFLIANGAKFEGASAATYVPAVNRLIVRNTQQELDLIDQIIAMAVAKGGKAISEDASLDGGTDEGFLNDMYLYFIGRAPTPEEVRAFAADPKPSREKRKAMVEGFAERLKAGGENAAPPTLPDGTLMVRGRNLVLNKDGQTGTLTLNQDGAPAGAADQGGKMVVTGGTLVLNKEGQKEMLTLNQGGASAGAADQGGQSVAAQKAEKIIIPAFDCKEATLDDALDFLRKAAVEADPEKKGVKIDIKPGTITKEVGDIRITMALRDVPVIEALRYITGLANVAFATTPDALVVQPTEARPAGPHGEPPPIPGLVPPPALPAPPAPLTPPAPQGAPGGNAGAAAAIDSPALTKASKIIIPKVELREVTLAEALDFLRVKARGIDPEGKGINILVKAEVPNTTRITMSLTNIPLIEALRYAAGLAGLQLNIEPNGLVLESPTAGRGISGAVDWRN